MFHVLWMATSLNAATIVHLTPVPLNRMLNEVTSNLNPISFVNPTDLSIDGPGWFILRDSATGGRLATRRGDFRVDQSGYLVT